MWGIDKYASLILLLCALCNHSRGFLLGRTKIHNPICQSKNNPGIYDDHLLSSIITSCDEKSETQKYNLHKNSVRSILLRYVVSLFVGLNVFPIISPCSVLADSVWTDRNRLAAETWRSVDEIFYDRTFNGQDWFKLRQQLVKKDFKTDEEVYDGIQKMLDMLGDKYTRYLTPAKYDALVNSAQGELTGRYPPPARSRRAG